jgi:uncharacterized membrane protein
MSLPNLTIPFELPLDIPLLMHPAVVHFAIAIPIIILLLEFINLFFNRRAISAISLFLVIVLVASMTVAYFTGGVDGKEAYSLLVSEGQAELKEHKLIGIYLVYASVALLAIKLLFMLFSGVVGRLFFLFVVITFTAVTLKQGKDGGELVYKYGANNQAVITLKENFDELQEEYNELEEESKEQESEKAKETPQSEPVKVKVEQESVSESNDTATVADTPATPKVEEKTEEKSLEEAVKEELKSEEKVESNKTTIPTESNTTN